MSETTDLTKELLSIESVNPSLSEEGSGEREIADAVREWCRERGLETHWLEPVPGRPSVVAIARGSGGGSSLMLNAHLDTVGTFGMTEPFEPRVEDGRLYGRGSMDMKAGLASCMHALADAAEQGLRGDVILTAVADEEHASIGTNAVLERFSADAAVVTEPTDLDLHVAHRGFAVFEVEARGRASHTSQPDRGVNAIRQIGKVLREIDALNRRLREAPPHPLLGHGSAQPVTISGGTELFTTPANCVLAYERRTLPGESAEFVRTELQRLLERAAEDDPDFFVETRTGVEREPFEVAEDEAIVRLLQSSVREQLGTDPRLLGAPYWMDAALIAAAGIPTVVFGPRGGGIHTTEEWVDLESIDVCTDVLKAAIRSFCA